MLHASETWPLSKTNLQRLQRNDRAMIRQICSIKPEDVATVRSSELLSKLQLEDLDLILRERRLRWFGHVELSSGAIRTSYDIQIEGRWGAGRPKQTWKKLTEKDCCEWKLTTVDPQERSTWSSGVRSAMVLVYQWKLAVQFGGITSGVWDKWNICSITSGIPVKISGKIWWYYQWCKGQVEYL